MYVEVDKKLYKRNKFNDKLCGIVAIDCIATGRVLGETTSRGELCQFEERQTRNFINSNKININKKLLIKRKKNYYATFTGDYTAVSFKQVYRSIATTKRT